MITIKNRFTGETILELETFRRANLEGANLEGADIEGVNLIYANLEGADLRHANLRHANLRRANLEGADLRHANLRHANLRRANLEGADLRHANLEGADLEGANLEVADLEGADIEGVNLRYTIGNGKEIKTLLSDRYTVNITKDRIQIGCENHSIEEWKNFTDNDIRNMDGNNGLHWWKEWKEIVLNIVKIKNNIKY